MPDGEEVVDTKPVAKYPGIKIGSILNFSLHIKSMDDKATLAVTKLSRLMPITRGPRASKGRLLM